MCKYHVQPHLAATAQIERDEADDAGRFVAVGRALRGEAGDILAVADDED